MLQGPRMNPRGMQQHFRGPGFMGAPMMRPYQMHQNQFGLRPMRSQGQFPQMMGRGPQSRQGGGFLAKLLGKGGRGTNSGLSGLLSAGNSTTRAASSSGGILQTLANPTAISGFLNNTQQVLKTAQQFGPMIQQYGPLVRNLPSMWRLYKGLKNMPDADELSKNEPEENKSTDEKPVKSVQPSESTDNASDEPKTKKSASKGKSTPKIFF